MRSALAKKSKEVVVIPTLGKYNAHISVIGMMANTTKRFAIAGIWPIMSLILILVISVVLSKYTFSNAKTILINKIANNTSTIATHRNLSNIVVLIISFVSNLEPKLK